tara:strand:+ start:374737 stop:375183 length:447 start_codon:yes stop_codon:yes gene_type:complete
MNKRPAIKRIFLLLPLLIVTFCNISYADNQSNIEIESFWVVLPPAVARSTAAYGIIRNTGESSDTLLDIRSDAGSVMLHKTAIESGMAHMFHMTNSVIKAHSELRLEPMSFHLMFTDLCPLVFIGGGTVTLWFEFENAGVIELKVPIR